MFRRILLCLSTAVFVCATGWAGADAHDTGEAISSFGALSKVSLLDYGVEEIVEVLTDPTTTIQGILDERISAARASSFSANAAPLSGYPGIVSGTFAVSSRGAANYNIPIVVPPGTAGMEPQLAVSYSNLNGNGVLGHGWSLGGISRISRCAKTVAIDGVAGGINYDEDDRFCLDGQRLIAVSGAYGQPGTEYRTEVDSYARITQLASVTNGLSNVFRVETKAGLEMLYGSPDASFSSEPNSKYFVWSIDRIVDSVGNYIAFDYEHHSSIETGREFTLKEVLYTGNSQAGVVPYNKVVFEYENRPDVVNRYVAHSIFFQTNRKRLSRIETVSNGAIAKIYRFGYELSGTRKSRLVQIEECAPDGGSEICFAPTTFSWTDKLLGFGGAHEGFGTPPELFSSSSELVDVNGDGMPDWVNSRAFCNDRGANCNNRNWLNSDTDRLMSPLPGWRIGPKEFTGPAPLFSGISRIGFLHDLNADGYVDQFVAQGSLIGAYMGSKNGFAGLDDNLIQFDATESSVAVRQDVDLATLQDINGDGLPDDIRSVLDHNNVDGATFLNRAWSTCTAKGCYWAEDAGYKLPHPLTTTNRKKLARLVELNGDGLPDLVAAYSYDGVSVLHAYLNTGEGWEAAPHYVPQELIRDGDEVLGDFADINGDGLDDLIYENRVRLNVGTGWDHAYFSAYNLPENVISDNGVTPRILFVDVSGDQLPDAVISGPGIVNRTLINRSTLECSSHRCKWEERSEYQLPQDLFFSSGYMGGSLSDLNGDGLLDIAYANSSREQSHINEGGMPDLLVSITNGFGSSIEVNYQPLTNADLYEKLGDAAYPYSDVTGPAYVVASYQTTNDLGSENLITYSYKGAKAHVAGRGFLGFEEITTEDVAAKTRVVELYETHYPQVGQRVLSTKQVKDRFNNWVTIQTTEYGHQASFINGVHTVVPTGTTTKKFTLNSGGSQEYLRTTVTRDDYDNFGCAGTVTTTSQTPDGNIASKVTQNVYENDVPNWYLCRLQQARVTHHKSGEPSVTDTTQFSYHAMTGLLTNETIHPLTSKQLSTTYGHDAFGNRISTERQALGETRSESQIFDDQGRFAESVSNALGHTIEMQHESKFGVLIYQSDANGVVTRQTVDPFGRVLAEISPTNSTVITEHNWCDSSCPTDGVYMIRTTGSDGSESYRVFNKNEREIASATIGFDGGWIYSETYYDQLGRVEKVSRPYFAGGSKYYSTFEYDVLGRRIREEHPVSEDGEIGTVEHAIVGLQVTRTDAEGKTKFTRKNAQGKVVESRDGGSVMSYYAYDARGNLISTTGPTGLTQQISYDQFGYKKALSDPDLGGWSYSYDAFGQLRSQTDAKNQTTTFEYDSLGRVKTRVGPEGTASWAYDNAAYAIGKPTSTTAPGYSQVFAYDQHSRPRKITTKHGGQTAVETQTWNAQNKLGIRQVEINGITEWFRYRYNSYGYLVIVRDEDETILWQAIAQDAFGQIEEERFESGFKTYNHFDRASGRPLSTETRAIFSSITAHSEATTWTAEGHLESRVNVAGGIDEEFGYDGLHRLTSVTLNGSPSLSLDYSKSGNIAYKSDVGTYLYSGGNRIRAVQNESGLQQFDYDDNGNMLYGMNALVDWTPFNKPARISRLYNIESDFDPSTRPIGSAYAEPPTGEEARRAAGQNDTHTQYVAEVSLNPSVEILASRPTSIACETCPGNDALLVPVAIELMVGRASDWSDEILLQSRTMLGFETPLDDLNVEALAEDVTSGLSDVSGLLGLGSIPATSSNQRSGVGAHFSSILALLIYANAALKKSDGDVGDITAWVGQHFGSEVAEATDVLLHQRLMPLLSALGQDRSARAQSDEPVADILAEAVEITVLLYAWAINSVVNLNPSVMEPDEVVPYLVDYLNYLSETMVGNVGIVQALAADLIGDVASDPVNLAVDAFDQAYNQVDALVIDQIESLDPELLANLVDGINEAVENSTDDFESIRDALFEFVREQAVEPSLELAIDAYNLTVTLVPSLLESIDELSDPEVLVGIAHEIITPIGEISSPYLELTFDLITQLYYDTPVYDVMLFGATLVLAIIDDPGGAVPADVIVELVYDAYQDALDMGGSSVEVFLNFVQNVLVLASAIQEYIETAADGVTDDVEPMVGAIVSIISDVDPQAIIVGYAEFLLLLYQEVIQGIEGASGQINEVIAQVAPIVLGYGEAVVNTVEGLVERLEGLEPNEVVAPYQQIIVDILALIGPEIEKAVADAESLVAEIYADTTKAGDEVEEEVERVALELQDAIAEYFAYAMAVVVAIGELDPNAEVQELVDAVEEFIEQNDPTGDLPDPQQLADTLVALTAVTIDYVGETVATISDDATHQPIVFQVGNLKYGLYNFRVRVKYLATVDTTDGSPVYRYSDPYIGPNTVFVNSSLGRIDPTDLDGDGVPNVVDGCPGTPSGQATTELGCHSSWTNTESFKYGPDRELIERSVSEQVKGGARSGKVQYLGGMLEVHDFGEPEYHFQIVAGNRRLGTVVRRGANDREVRFQHQDHLGSVVAITQSGLVVDRFSYDAFGQRRSLDGSRDTDGSLTYFDRYSTEKGYGGHETLGGVGLVHMGGRVYDPLLGRFTSPDPIVQLPLNTQGLNRYSYTLNAPLTYTDPSGHWIPFAIAAAVLITAGEVFDEPLLTNIGIALIPIPGGQLAAVGKGFAAGLITSDGDLRAAVVGGVAAGLSFTVGEVYGDPKFLSSNFAKKVVAHGLIGGQRQAISGGSFRAGFLSGGFTQAASPLIGMGESDVNVANSFSRISAAAIVGGTASALGGGKFANGAVTGVFIQAFNHEAHRESLRQRAQRLGNFVLDEGGNIVFRTATTIGGAGQVLLGGSLCATVAGCTIGGTLATLGASNIQEGLTGQPGFVRSQATSLIGGGAGNLAVDVVNIGSSGIGLLRPVVQPGAFKLFNYIRSDFVSAFRTATNTGLTAEVGAGTLGAVDTLDRYYGN